MSKNYVSQKVYDALKDIASYKNEYTYNESVGNTQKAQEYHQAAIPKYDVVKNYSYDLYDQLKGLDHNGARQLLNDYAVARDEKSILGDIGMGKYGWANSKTDADRNKFATNTAQYYDELAAVNPQLADVVKGWDYDQLNYYIKTGEKPEIKKPEAPKERTMWDVARDIVGFKTGYEGSYSAGNPEYWKEHNNAEPYYAELEAMGPEGKALAAELRGSNAEQAKAYIEKNAPIKPMTGNEAMTQTQNMIGNAGTSIMDNINKMYFDKDYGKDVMDMFNLYGGQKAQQAMANTAAANGGNYDSFAEYNKGLTDMSYKIAGANAVENMRRGYADSSTNFLDTWGNQLITNAGNLADYEYKDKGLTSNERIETARNDTDKTIAQIEAAATEKGYDAETVSAIVGDATELLLNDKDPSKLQEFLNKYGIVIPAGNFATASATAPATAATTVPEGTNAGDTSGNNAGAANTTNAAGLGSVPGGTATAQTYSPEELNPWNWDNEPPESSGNNSEAVKPNGKSGAAGEAKTTGNAKESSLSYNDAKEEIEAGLDFHLDDKVDFIISVCTKCSPDVAKQIAHDYLDEDILSFEEWLKNK